MYCHRWLLVHTASISHRMAHNFKDNLILPKVLFQNLFCVDMFGELFTCDWPPFSSLLIIHLGSLLWVSWAEKNDKKKQADGLVSQIMKYSLLTDPHFTTDGFGNSTAPTLGWVWDKSYIDHPTQPQSPPPQSFITIYVLAFWERQRAAMMMTLIVKMIELMETIPMQMMITVGDRSAAVEGDSLPFEVIARKRRHCPPVECV